MTAVSAGFDTLNVLQQGGVLFAEIAAPPMNLLGPGLDLARTLRRGRVMRVALLGMTAVRK